MAFTFGQLYDKFCSLWDMAGSPYMPQAQFDDIANNKLEKFIALECARSETNEEYSTHIDKLYRDFQKLNSDTVLFPADISDFRYLLRFSARFKVMCGMSVKYIERPIRKARNNSVGQMQIDPFNKGIDEDPTYLITNDGANTIYKIISGSTPVEINVAYVKKQAKINSAGSPSSVFELPDYVAEALINAIVTRSDILIENFNRAKFESDPER